MATPSTAPDAGSLRLVLETPETVRKQGKTFRLRREVEAMEFVRSRTLIPLPRVHETHFDRDENEQGWIIMQRLPGDQLGDAWPTMSESSRSETLSQLKSFLKQLHDIRPDGAGWIGSCSRGPAYDHRLNNTAMCGPFATISDFHDFLVRPVKDCPRPELADRYRSQLSDKMDIVFTHADISWENILVHRASGHVTGILDWEMAGFWPEWWEYRKALFASRSNQWISTYA